MPLPYRTHYMMQGKPACLMIYYCTSFCNDLLSIYTRNSRTIEMNTSQSATSILLENKFNGKFEIKTWRVDCQMKFPCIDVSHRFSSLWGLRKHNLSTLIWLGDIMLVCYRFKIRHFSRTFLYICLAFQSLSRCYVSLRFVVNKLWQPLL